MHGMLVREIMKRHVYAIAPTDNVQSAARTMREQDVGFLPVCEPTGRVIGILTDRDLALRICADDLPSSTTTIAAIMTPNVVACSPDDTVLRVEALMREHRRTRVVVTDTSGSLLGVLSLLDLAVYEPTARIGRTLRAVAERKYSPRGGP